MTAFGGIATVALWATREPPVIETNNANKRLSKRKLTMSRAHPAARWWANPIP